MTEEKRPKLSPTMLACVEWMHKHGGMIHRSPGGYWRGLKELHGVYFDTSTVQALLKRGVVEYSEWQEGRSGRFPIAAKLIAPVRTVLVFQREELEMR